MKQFLHPQEKSEIYFFSFTYCKDIVLDEFLPKIISTVQTWLNHFHLKVKQQNCVYISGIYNTTKSKSLMKTI